MKKVVLYAEINFQRHGVYSSTMTSSSHGYKDSCWDVLISRCHSKEWKEASFYGRIYPPCRYVQFHRFTFFLFVSIASWHAENGDDEKEDGKRMHWILVIAPMRFDPMTLN